MSLNNKTLYPDHIALTSKTAAKWTSANPTLLAGEIGIESDTLRMKAGDGKTAWKSLSYTDSAVRTSITELQTKLTAAETKITSLEERATELETLAKAIMETTTSVIQNIMKGEVQVR